MARLFDAANHPGPSTWIGRDPDPCLIAADIHASSALDVDEAASYGTDVILLLVRRCACVLSFAAPLFSLLGGDEGRLFFCWRRFLSQEAKPLLPATSEKDLRVSIGSTIAASQGSSIIKSVLLPAEAVRKTRKKWILLLLLACRG